MNKILCSTILFASLFVTQENVQAGNISNGYRYHSHYLKVFAKHFRTSQSRVKHLLNYQLNHIPGIKGLHQLVCATYTRKSYPVKISACLVYSKQNKQGHRAKKGLWFIRTLWKAPHRSAFALVEILDLKKRLHKLPRYWNYHYKGRYQVLKTPKKPAQHPILVLVSQKTSKLRSSVYLDLISLNSNVLRSIGNFQISLTRKTTSSRRRRKRPWCSFYQKKTRDLILVNHTKRGTLVRQKTSRLCSRRYIKTRDYNPKYTDYLLCSKGLHKGTFQRVSRWTKPCRG